MKFVICILGLSLSSCYAEWDMAKIPRHDPCLELAHRLGLYVNENPSYLYVPHYNLICPTPSPRSPRDNDEVQ